MGSLVHKAQSFSFRMGFGCMGMREFQAALVTYWSFGMTIETSSWYSRWAPSCTNHESQTWLKNIHSMREGEAGRPPVSDLATLYPEAVVASSDGFGWQNVRVIHLRHRLNEVV